MPPIAATTTAQAGGDLGVLPFTAVPVEMADDLASAKVGDIVKVWVLGVDVNKKRISLTMRKDKLNEN